MTRPDRSLATRPVEATDVVPALERAAPTANSRHRRRAIWLASLVVVAGLATGYVLLAGSGSDVMAAGDRQVLSATLSSAVITAPRVDMNDSRQVELATQALNLAPPQVEQILADAREGKVQLAWIALRDYLDEDGDAVEVSTGGLTRTVLLTNAPQMIAVPVVPGDFLRVTGIRDGAGGGITVSVAAGGAEIRFPPLEVDQTVTLPVR